MTSLHLDASFAMTPHVFHLRHPAVPNAPPVLWPKPVKPIIRSFKAKPIKPSCTPCMVWLTDVDACLTSHQVPQRLQDLSCSRRIGNLLELVIAFLLDLADTIFNTISPSMYSCSDHAPCGLPMSPSGILRSLGAKPPLVLHHRMMHRHQASCLPVITAWYIASN